MRCRHNFSRRGFLRGLAGGGAAALIAGRSARAARVGLQDLSAVFRVEECPIHDGELRHVGVDAMLHLLGSNGVKLYRSDVPHPWAGPEGIIEADDVVLVKVNCQWKCRGTTNTDVLRGFIHRVLQHPEGFRGEVVIIENGQGRGAFDGISIENLDWYGDWPEVATEVVVNAEEERTLTIEYLVNTVFADQPVSAYLLDRIRSTFITAGDHQTDGYRIATPPVGTSPASPVSYPCFTTAGGRRIELRQGVWTGTGYADDVKLINMPVLKHHEGCGFTGALKHAYGILTMSDGQSRVRHYGEIGSQCGKVWSLVRTADLNILDCIWVSHESLTGYPPDTTRRCDVLLAGLDPVALDYYASKHVLLPLGGRYASRHDPDSSFEASSMLTGAQSYMNSSGGIGGVPTRLGEDRIEVVSRRAVETRVPRRLIRKS